MTGCGCPTRMATTTSTTPTMTRATMRVMAVRRARSATIFGLPDEDGYDGVDYSDGDPGDDEGDGGEESPFGDELRLPDEDGYDGVDYSDDDDYDYDEYDDGSEGELLFDGDPDEYELRFRRPRATRPHSPVLATCSSSTTPACTSRHRGPGGCRAWNVVAASGSKPAASDASSATSSPGRC